MSSNPLRPVLAAVLMAVFLISLLPVSFAGSPIGSTEQSSLSDRPRRGKNGQAVAKDGVKQDSKPKKQEATPQSQAPPPPSSTQPPPADRRSPVVKEPVGAQRENDPFKSDPPSSQAPQNEGTQRKPEPPPFDRPPIRQDENSQGGTATQDTRPATRPVLDARPHQTAERPRANSLALIREINRPRLNQAAQTHLQAR
jgi:outer membrane biosynthesis protein TonB